MQSVITITTDNLIIVHDTKHLELHFFRPRVGIEEDMSGTQLKNHIQRKFRRWTGGK